MGIIRSAQAGGRARVEQAARDATGFGALAATLGGIALAGWFMGSPALVTLVRGGPPMLPQTAVSVVCAGLAVVLVARRSRSPLAATLAIVPLAVGGFHLLERVFGVRTALGDVFIPAVWGAPDLVGRRPAAVTSAALVAMSVATLIARKRPRIAQAIASAVALVSVAALVGHAYRLEGLSALGPLQAVAVHTSVALGAIAAAVVLIRPDRALGAVLTSEEGAGIVARRLLLPALLLPLVVGWGVLLGQRAGWYGPSSSVAILVLVLTLLLTAEILLAARAVALADRERDAAETARLVSALRERDARALVAAKEEALKARDEFLSIASHELRTPLAALRAQIQLALRRRGEEPRPRLEAADRAASRMGRLLEDLLQVARINSGRLPQELTPGDVDLAATTREVAGRFGRAAAHAGSSITVSGADICHGRWDHAGLEEVLSQLLSNALKYGAARPVEVVVGADARAAWITVRDHGLGIAPEVRERIFQRFERAVSIRNFGGFGLGLWIARQIVEAHGGRISVESTPGHGAAFTVALPRRWGVEIEGPVPPEAPGAEAR